MFDNRPGGLDGPPRKPFGSKILDAFGVLLGVIIVGTPVALILLAFWWAILWLWGNLPV